MAGLVDRIARKPSGFLGWLFYRFPLGHRAGFDLVLQRCGPVATDRILEVGCGGGVFMRRVLASGCRAVGIDHSADMLDSTRKVNAAALREGRLVLEQADAAALPVGSGEFDKVYCLNAFFFFPDPQAAVREMARALRPGGAVAIVTSPPEMEHQIRRFSSSMAAAMRFDRAGDLATMFQIAGLEPEPPAGLPNAGYLMLARKPC